MIRREAGFTLVEIVIAMAIFSLFMLATVGSFVAIEQIHERALLERKALESARVFTDDFARVALLTNTSASNTSLSADVCTNTLTLENTYKGSNESYTFTDTNGIVYLTVNNGAASGSATPVTDPDLTVTQYNGTNFCPKGGVGPDNIFRYVVSSSPDGESYVKLSFQITPLKTGNSPVFQLPGNGKITLVTSFNIRTGESK